MKVTLSWLREFAPLVGSADEIAHQLADLGLPVEGTEVVGEPIDGVITAKILDVRAHPKADRIRLVDVDAGDGEPRQICCGAPNLYVGDVVPLATIGTVMPNGMDIAYREMRGEASNGMLCSARELGLGDDHEGLLTLPTETPLGIGIFDAIGLDQDVVFDLDVTPNRPEALSVAGVARDLAARQGVPFSIPSHPTTAGAIADASEIAAIELVDTQLCGRFTARVLDGISIAPSPSWMQHRLNQAGMRPINNVVDVSNYVMLELGQPSHAFDLDKVEGGKLVVRSARDGEQITTLDGKVRTLSSADGAICNAAGEPIAIAGVMGGASTEISDTTRRALIEMAWWDPLRVESTAVRHQLHSEASLRFKRGCDPEVYPVAMDRFIHLLSETCDVVVHPSTLVVDGELPAPADIPVRPDRVSALLGAAISADEIETLLTPIGFSCAPSAADPTQLTVTAPSFRPDCQVEIDIVEEVARMRSYERIEFVVPRPPQTGSLSESQRRLRSLRSGLHGALVDEAMPLPFLAPDDLERCGLDSVGLQLANPLVADESVLRTSLRPGLLKAISHNAAHRNSGVRLFEIGRIFPPSGLVTDVAASVSAGRVLSGERSELCVCLAGEDASAAVGLAQLIVRSLGCDTTALRMSAGTPAGLHPTRSATVTLGDVTIGVVGEVHPDVLERLSIDERVAVVEVSLDAVLSVPAAAIQAQLVSKYPASDFDLAFIVDSGRTAYELLDTVRQADGLVNSASISDVYRSETLGADKKSITVSIRLQSLDHTLDDAEIKAARASILAAAESALGAVLRS